MAIRNHSGGCFKKGDIFAIQALKMPHCRADYILIDIGVLTRENEMECGICHQAYPTNNGAAWFNSTNFRPLDELVSIEQLTEHLETTKPFEI